MSYSIYLTLETKVCAACGHKKLKAEVPAAWADDVHERDGDFEIDCGNYTSNMSGAWDHAGISLRDADGMPADHLAKKIREGVAKIEADPAFYKSFEPANGWGNVERMLAWLNQIRFRCEQFPTARVRVCR